VVAEDDARALVFDKDQLRQFFKNETEVAGLIYQLIRRELAHKVKVSNTPIAAAP
jgi:CRP-like cAMP-binding protein